MYIYIPEFNTNNLKGTTESFFIIPFLTDVHYDFLSKTIELHNEGFFTNLFFNPPDNIKLTSLEKCDYVVLPYKYNPNSSDINQICDKANA